MPGWSKYLGRLDPCYVYKSRQHINTLSYFGQCLAAIVCIRPTLPCTNYKTFLVRAVMSCIEQAITNGVWTANGWFVDIL